MLKNVSYVMNEIQATFINGLLLLEVIFPLLYCYLPIFFFPSIRKIKIERVFCDLGCSQVRMFLGYIVL